MKLLRGILYILVQTTWGILQSFTGFIVFLLNFRKRHFMYHGAVVTQWDSLSSVSLGMFVFVSGHRLTDRRSKDRLSDEAASRALLVHEYGHTIQSLVLGPLYLPLIGLPSLLWATGRKPRNIRLAGTPYSAFWTEHSANVLGEKVTKERSLEDVVL